jgi:hypothetical protein
MKDIFVSTYDMRETSFSDQTSQFPKQSKRGHKYIMVLVEIDSNAIMVEPMKSRKDAEMIRAYDVLVQRLQQANIHPRKHVLDNRKHETTHQRKIQIRIGNGTAGVPSTKRSQSSHPQFQIPFPQRTCWDGGVISTPLMGQTTTTNRNYPKPTATIECNTHGFSIRTLIWTIRLQQNAISPNGLQSTNPRKNGQTRHVVIPFCGWMVFINVTRTLQSPQLLCQNNPGGKTHRHHPIQAQEYNQPNHQPA